MGGKSNGGTGGDADDVSTIKIVELPLSTTRCFCCGKVVHYQGDFPNKKKGYCPCGQCCHSRHDGGGHHSPKYGNDQPKQLLRQERRVIRMSSG